MREAAELLLAEVQAQRAVQLAPFESREPRAFHDNMLYDGCKRMVSSILVDFFHFRAS
jgi:hypothetical protein